MDFLKDVPLGPYSTLRLGGRAKYLLEVTDQSTMVAAVEAATKDDLPVILIGGGSNIIWRDEGYPGLVLINRISGFEIIAEDDLTASLTIGSGEDWDSVVARSVEHGLSGIECLSLIPGTAGATPVQNVGAYGQEISQVLAAVTAYDRQAKTMVTLSAADCNFSYRSSIFKTTAKDRYFISGISLVLNKSKMLPPFYSVLASYLEEHHISDYSPAALRSAVVDIRSHKLPDPKITPNCGSFFANPIVDRADFMALEAQYEAVPSWSISDDRVKVSAGWLIEQAGFKDYYDKQTGIATWPMQSLVFINRSAKSTIDLLRFASKVQAKVKSMFNIELIMEPQLLP